MKMRSTLPNSSNIQIMPAELPAIESIKEDTQRQLIVAESEQLIGDVIKSEGEKE